MLTECTWNTPTGTRTRTWRMSSPTRPRPTTARSPTGWNPTTTWTFTRASGGRRTGQNSIPALPTPGFKPAAAPEQKGLPVVLPRRGAAKHKRAQNFYFHELWLFRCVCCKVNVCACFGGEFNWAMADGKRERVPKKEIKECFLFFK